VFEHLNSRLFLAIGASAAIMVGVAVAGAPGELADPTRPSGWQASPVLPAARQVRPVDALKLQGTFNVAGERSAMLSGRRVTVGDEVGGATVIGIDKNKVILRVGGETVELASVAPVVKAPAHARGDQR